MNKQLNDIVEFMTAFGQEVKHKIELPSYKIVKLREELAKEELRETLEGIEEYNNALNQHTFTINKDKNTLIVGYKEVLDGIIDQIVILAGTLNAYGVTYGDGNVHNKWNELLDFYLNGGKFEFPLENLNLGNNISLIRENIFYTIEQLEKLSERAFLMNHEIDSGKVIFLTNKLLVEILKLANDCGLKDRKLFELIWEEIHGSNMSKLGADGKPVYREDGKILKGENYRKPNIIKVLTDYMN